LKHTLEYKYLKQLDLSKVEKEERYTLYHAVQNKARDDYAWFCRHVLGYQDMNTVHDWLCRGIQNRRRRNRLILLPRYSFKSCIVTIGYSLWRIFRDPNVRILIYSDTATKAQGFLRGIKAHIEGSDGENASLFRKYIGKYDNDIHSGKWNENAITVKYRTAGHSEPTVDTGSYEASKVGMHYDIIIFDDIVSKLNVNTKALMDKVWECYQESLSLLKPGGDVIICGTRWHFGDAYGRMIARDKARDNFDLFIKDADERNEDGSLIFEDIGLDEKFLNEQKAEQGSYIYSCLYKNNPVSSDEQIFRNENFKFYGQLQESPTPLETGLYENLYITCTVDPAGEGSDPTGGVVVGTDNTNRMHILEILNKSLKPDEIVKWIMNMNLKYRLRKLGIETNFFRGMLKRELDRMLREMREQNPGFNSFSIIEFSPSAKKGENKLVRFLDLQPYHERGEIVFPGESLELLRGGFGELAHQMMQVTRTHMPEPNDVLDALAYQPRLIMKGGEAKKGGVPEYSPAWIEQQYIEKHRQLQKRLPSWRRRKIKTIFS